MADWILYNGELSRGLDLEFIELVDSNKDSDHAVLILVSGGGNADAAYKIGRYLQDTYQNYDVLLSGLCKSAGTLLAISGNGLIFTPYGELGPLDVQLTKEDKLGVQESGLDISEAFISMEGRASDLYHVLINEIFSASNGIVSLRTAMKAASQMISALYGPVFARFNPEDVGARARAMRIGEEYAIRLNSKSMNLKEEFVQELSRSYPSHGFVIDFAEAERMFNNVRRANKSEIETIKLLGKVARFPSPEPQMKFLSSNEVYQNEYEVGDNISSQEQFSRGTRKKNGRNTKKTSRT